MRAVVVVVVVAVVIWETMHLSISFSLRKFPSIRQLPFHLKLSDGVELGFFTLKWLLFSLTLFLLGGGTYCLPLRFFCIEISGNAYFNSKVGHFS